MFYLISYLNYFRINRRKKNCTSGVCYSLQVHAVEFSWCFHISWNLWGHQSLGAVIFPLHGSVIRMKTERKIQQRDNDKHLKCPILSSCGIQYLVKTKNTFWVHTNITNRSHLSHNSNTPSMLYNMQNIFRTCSIFHYSTNIY